ncbi:Protein of unknown function [Bacillus mycoides]|nr:Protein of unknown function [Bacillus mycoides]
MAQEQLSGQYKVH